MPTDKSIKAIRDRQQETALWKYAVAHTTPLGGLLRDLERETHLKTLHPQMLSGEYQGQVLRMFSLMLRPKRILEIGTFTGYSTLCLAQGLAEQGELHTIEINEELAWFLSKYKEKAGLSEEIIQHIGDAKDIIPTLASGFDLVFMDAGKMDYPQHFELALARMNFGAFLIADNILWDGKILAGKQDETTQILRKFNADIQTNPNLENILLPFGDGLMVVRKVK